MTREASWERPGPCGEEQLCADGRQSRLGRGGDWAPSGEGAAGGLLPRKLGVQDVPSGVVKKICPPSLGPGLMQ